MYKNLLIGLFVLLITASFFYAGCSKNDVVNPPVPVRDTNVVAFDSLIISEYFDDNSYSSVDLFKGLAVPEFTAPQLKDIQVRDSSGTRYNFIFRSGDLAKKNPGFESKFGVVNLNIKRAQFDTLSKIYNASSPPDTVLDFTYNPTVTPYYFNVGDTTKQCLSFYLKGKFAYNGGIFCGYKRVFGIMLIDSIYKSPGVDTVKIRLKVRINKDSKNKFNLYD